MPVGDSSKDHDSLTPREAAYIATNVYFTLKDWVKYDPDEKVKVKVKPKAGLEDLRIINRQVLGRNAQSYEDEFRGLRTSLAHTGLAESRLDTVLNAKTGFGTQSGFGYTLKFESSHSRHAIVAVRGTRPEMSGKPDMITNLRGGLAPFEEFGAVHKGFKRTFDTILPQLGSPQVMNMLKNADVVHFVGHSLGGGVATLLAAHFRSRLDNGVKLYTFGSPRVGGFNTYSALEHKIGVSNIYRVAHDLDPITLIGPYPFIHVLPAPSYQNNFTLMSPHGLGLGNHDMNEYIKAVGGLEWQHLRGFAAGTDHNQAALVKALLHGGREPGWLQVGAAYSLSLLFKLFSHALRGVSTSLILSLTAVDLLAELLARGLQLLKRLGDEIVQLLVYLAKWAGLVVKRTAEFSAEVIRLLLGKMLATLERMSIEALMRLTHSIVPMTLPLMAGWHLIPGLAF